MPPGIGYGIASRVGKHLWAGATGKYGAGVAGGIWGAGYGAGSGAVRSDRSVMGGAFGGALRGAMLGTAVGVGRGTARGLRGNMAAFSAGASGKQYSAWRNTVRGQARARGGAFPAAPKMRSWGQAFSSAINMEKRKAMGFARGMGYTSVKSNKSI